MKRGKDLIGMSVANIGDGSLLGRVRDLVFDSKVSRVRALVLEEVDTEIIPWDAVRIIGTDLIFVRGGAKIRLQDDEEIAGLVPRETCLSGTRIFNPSGVHLGTLADTIMDQISGVVTGYEVSEGFLADALHGKRILPAPPHLSVEGDVVIAEADVADQLNPAP